jgi:hypothetical protein
MNPTNDRLILTGMLQMVSFVTSDKYSRDFRVSEPRRAQLLVLPAGPFRWRGRGGCAAMDRNIRLPLHNVSSQAIVTLSGKDNCP